MLNFGNITPNPTPSQVPLDKMKFPSLPTGQGFDIPLAHTVTVLQLVLAVLSIIAAGTLIYLVMAKKVHHTKLWKGGTIVALSVALLAPLGLVVTGLSADGNPGGYGQFHTWAQKRYSLTIGQPGYQALLKHQPITVARMGQRIEIQMITGDDGLGYLFVNNFSQELAVHPNSAGVSMDCATLLTTLNCSSGGGVPPTGVLPPPTNQMSLTPVPTPSK